MPAGNCPACLLRIGLSVRGEESAGAEAGPGGRVFGNYDLQGQLGSGGMGIVFRAYDRELKRSVALKMIRRGEFASAKEVERFKREAEAAASLDHPNIVPVYEVGELDGWHYLSLKLVEGTSLDRDTLRFQTDYRATAILLAKVARAVHHAHQRGLLHRDLKPSNILLDQQGEPYVTDFGLAKRVEQDRKLTLSGQMVGTPAYMAPEQARGSSGLTIAVDIYSLGVILYELLTGDVPFRGQTPWETLRQAVEQEPKAPGAARAGVDRDLETICLRCLSKEPERRYGSSEALAEELERWLRHEPILARPSGVWSRGVKWTRRHPAPAALLVVLIAGLAMSTWQAIRATRAEGKAARHAAGETASRALAEQAAEEARKTIAHLDFIQAGRLIEQGNDPEAVAYLVRSLRANPANSAAVTRLATLLAYRTWMVPSKVMNGHTAVVTRAGFSPDGRSIVSVSKDNSARLWDAQSGQPIAHPLQHSSQVFSARFSPDGGRVVTASADCTARVWNAQTGEPLGEPLAHAKEVWCAHFSPDGLRVITASMDGTAVVWDWRSGRKLARLQHRGGVNCGRFSPDGKLISTASEDGTARLWDASTGEAVGVPLCHNGEVYSAVFSPDSGIVVTASADSSARLWDARTGRAFGEPMLHSNGTRVWSAEFSPDGKQVVTASEDCSARVWDAQTGKPVSPPLKHTAWVEVARFSPDGKRVVTASSDGLAQAWDARSGVKRGESLRHRAEVCSAQFSPDGRHILTASADKSVRLWDTFPGGALPQTLSQAPGCSARFNASGSRVVTASKDCSARVWDSRNGQPLTESMRHPSVVTSAGFSPDERRIMTVCSDFTARIWDAQTGALVAGPMAHTNIIHMARFNPDGSRLITASSDNTAMVWDASTGKPALEPLRHAGWIYAATFSPDGGTILTGSDDGTAGIWDARTGQLLRKVSHSKPIRSAEFNHDGSKVATSSWDSTARVWDAPTGNPVTPPLRHGGWPETVRFSRDGNRIVTACNDQSARVWDSRTGLLVSEPMLHKAGVLLAEFSGDGSRVFTMARDGSVTVWDASTSQVLLETTPTKWVNHAEFSPDGARIVICPDDGPARIWDIAPLETNFPPWLLKLAEVFGGKVLGSQSVVTDSPLDGVIETERLHRELNAAHDDQPWVLWGRWLLADRSIRMASPFSTRDVPAHIEGLIKMGRSEGCQRLLDEAESLAVGKAELLARITEARQPFKLRDEAVDFACQRQFGLAISNFQAAVLLNEDMPTLWGIYGMTAARLGDVEAYSKVRTAMLSKYGGSQLWQQANPVGRAALLMPCEQPELGVAVALAKVAAEAGKNSGTHMYAQELLAFAEYRLGHFAEAETLARDYLSKSTRGIAQHAQAGSILAMALYKQGRQKEAHAALQAARAIQLSDLASPNGKAVWPAVLNAETLLREATELIEGAARQDLDSSRR